MTNTDQAAKRLPAWVLPLFLAVLTAFRLYYGQMLPLSEDEANAWQWSRHLDTGYYDQGPMVAWLIRLGTLLLGHTELGVRAPAALLTLGLSLLLYQFCRRIFKDELLGFWLTVATNGTLFFTAAGIIHTYDTEQAFFWMVGLLGVALAIFEERPWGWYLAGPACGLALLAKYVAAFLPVLTFLFLLCHPRHRYWLRRREPWLAALMAGLVFSPNLIWNATHHWTAFGHSLGLAAGKWNFTTFEFLGGQAALIGPVGFVVLVLGLGVAWGRARRGDDRLAYLLWTSVPVLSFFLLESVKGRVYANWTGPAYLAAFLAAGQALRPHLARSIAWRRTFVATMVTGFLLVGVALCHVPILRALNLPADSDPTQKLYGWPQLGQAIGAELAAWPGGPRPFIFGLRYQQASLAAFYTPGQPETEGLFLPGYRLNCYLFWTDPRRLAGRSGLAVVDGTPPLDLLFDGVTLLKTVDMVGPTGRVINQAVLYRCEGFKGRDFRPEEFLSH